MKKRVIISILFLSILIVSHIALILADQTDASALELEKTDKAYAWLENAVNNTWNSMSVSDTALSLITLSYDSKLANDGKTALMSKSLKDGICWPSTGNTCKLKETAQALIALSRLGINTDNIQNWILSQNSTPTDLTWYLEIDTPGQANCSVTYGASYNFKINDDKTLSSSAGSCLSPANNNYFFKISQSCIDKTFSVTCDSDFTTALAYQRSGSATYYISNEAKRESAQGYTSNSITAICFKNENENSCDYEGTAWASLALTRFSSQDVSQAIPYLTGYTDNNNKYLPQAFLYVLTAKTEYLQALLDEQKQNYWQAPNSPYGRFYDTALALMAIGPEGDAVDSAKQFLLSSQSDQGSWQDSKRDTALILFALYPKTPISLSTPSENESNIVPGCEDNGFYCVSTGKCDIADKKTNFNCPYTSEICCAKNIPLDSCSDMSGQICTSGKVCSQSETAASDTTKCCLGTCDEAVTDTCESNGYTCSVACSDTEEQVAGICSDSNKMCCKEKAAQSSSSSWIWIILAVLIVGILVLGYVFRDKLKGIFRKKPSTTLPPTAPSPGLRPASLPIRRPMSMPMQRQAPRQGNFSNSNQQVSQTLDKIRRMQK